MLNSDKQDRHSFRDSAPHFVQFNWTHSIFEDKIYQADNIVHNSMNYLISSIFRIFWGFFGMISDLCVDPARFAGETMTVWLLSLTMSLVTLSI
jgi:hypothetical protein